METVNQKEEKELQICFDQWLPKELQIETRRLQLMCKTINFFGFDSLPLRSLQGQTGWVHSIAIANNKVVTASDDVKIWDIATGQPLIALERYISSVQSVATDGEKAVTGSENGIARICDINTGQLLHILRLGHMVWIKSVAIASDKVVTGSDDGIAKIWNLNTGELLYTLEGHTKWINSVAIANDKVVTASADTTAKIWNINTGELLQTLQCYASIRSVAITDDKVVTGAYDGTIKILDIKSGQLLHNFQGHKSCVTSLAIADDTLVTVSSDGTAKIWDLKINQLLHTIEGYNVNSVAISGDQIVIGLTDGAKIWSLAPCKGTEQNNPLLWIMYHADIPQLDLINHAYEAMLAGKRFIIALPEKLGKMKEDESQAQWDGRIYFTFPVVVRTYLRDRLNIKAC